MDVLLDSKADVLEESTESLQLNIKVPNASNVAPNANAIITSPVRNYKNEGMVVEVSDTSIENSTIPSEPSPLGIDTSYVRESTSLHDNVTEARVDDSVVETSAKVSDSETSAVTTNETTVESVATAAVDRLDSVTSDTPNKGSETIPHTAELQSAEVGHHETQFGILPKSNSHSTFV